jgi:hypothetical protein
MTVDIDDTEAGDLEPGARASAEALASWQEAADRSEAVKKGDEAAWMKKHAAR